MNDADLSVLVRQLNAIVRKLEMAFPGRKFTLDGHLPGSIGEVVAATRYDLKLLPNSARGHDAVTADKSKAVQIKLTQGASGSVGLRSKPEHLIVLLLNSGGDVVEVYNGPGDIVWHAVGKKQSNGQHFIGLNRLREIAATLSASDRLPVARFAN